MRRYKDTPARADYRVINKFLFFPWTLGGEMRWLERASILQQFNGDYWCSLFWAESTLVISKNRGNIYLLKATGEEFRLIATDGDVCDRYDSIESMERFCNFLSVAHIVQPAEMLVGKPVFPPNIDVRISCF